MATQSATARWPIRTFTGVTTTQAVPTTGFRHPAKGQWNIPGRLSGWEDSSKVRFFTGTATITGTIGTAEIIIVRKVNDLDTDPSPIARLPYSAASGGFQATAALPIGPGAYNAYLVLTGGTTPNVTVTVYLEGLNEDYL